MAINVNWGSPVVLFAHQLQQEAEQTAERQQQLGMQARQQAFNEAQAQANFALHAQQAQNDSAMRAAQMQLGYMKDVDQSAQHWYGLQRQDANLERQFQRDQNWYDIKQQQMQNQADIAGNRQEGLNQWRQQRAELDREHTDLKREMPNIRMEALEQKQMTDLDGAISSIQGQVGRGELRPWEADAKIAQLQQQQVGILRNAKTRQTRQPDSQTELRRRRDASVLDEDGQEVQQGQDGQWVPVDRQDRISLKDSFEIRNKIREGLMTKDANGKMVAPSEEDVQAAYDKHLEGWKAENQKWQDSKSVNALDDRVLSGELQSIIKDGGGMGLSPVHQRDATTLTTLLKHYGYFDKMPEAQKEQFMEAFGNLGKVLSDDAKERIGKRAYAPSDWQHPRAKVSAEKLPMPTDEGKFSLLGEMKGMAKNAAAAAANAPPPEFSGIPGMAQRFAQEAQVVPQAAAQMQQAAAGLPEESKMQFAAAADAVSSGQYQSMPDAEFAKLFKLLETHRDRVPAAIARAVAAELVRRQKGQEPQAAGQAPSLRDPVNPLNSPWAFRQQAAADQSLRNPVNPLNSPWAFK